MNELRDGKSRNARLHFVPLPAFQLLLLFVSTFGVRAASFAAPDAVVQTFTGQTYRGAPVISDVIEIQTDQGPVRIALDHILRASFTGSDAREMVPAGIALTNGTRLAGSVGALSGSTIDLPSRGQRVPASLVAWIIYSPFPPSHATSLPAGKVGALLPGGDFFEGTLKGADASHSKLQNPIFGLRTFDVRRDELSALVLKDVKPASVNFEVRTADGSLYLADSIASWNGTVTIRGAHFDTLTFKPENLAELRAGTARYLPLTQLKPAGVPAAGRLALDKTLAGEPLTSEDSAPVRGIESAVGEVGSWEVPTGFTVLSARVRVPADVPPINQLAFVVYADGRAVFRSPVLTSGDTAVEVRAPLGNARSIALRVEGVSPTNAAGRGLWLEPALLRR